MFLFPVSAMFLHTLPLTVALRGNREEAHSLQERKQVLEDAHLLSGQNLGVC